LYTIRRLSRRSPLRLLLVTLVAVGSVVAVSHIASASIPSSAGVITACFNKQSHLLRVIDAHATRCTSAERTLRWSQSGPQGPTGARGPRGKVGPTGPEGAVGATGATGAVGPTGPQGPVGPQGPIGPAGQTGLRGAQGPAGPAGITWRGQWSQLVTYNPYDAVAYNGSSWIAVAQNVNVAPSTSNPFWNELAAQGAAGIQGPPGAPATRLFAVVTAAGVVSHQSGVQGVNKISTGTYQIVFSQDVSACAYETTLGGQTSIFAVGFASNTRDPLNGATVDVKTFATDGTTATDEPFHLTVTC
jgi:Collagen triple helix repeat (20 copies)